VTDQALGFVIIGVGIVFVLGLVFAISSRAGGPATGGAPPRGVHMPAPSWLPVAITVAAGLIGAGLALKRDYGLANPWLAVPGLLVLVGSIVAWVRAAGHEWRDTEQRPHDDAGAH